MQYGDTVVSVCPSRSIVRPASVGETVWAKLLGKMLKKSASIALQQPHP
jgi:hypothetical protein